MWNQNNLVIPPHMNLAKVTQIVFCLYFVMQRAINLAEVRQVAGGTTNVLCCFKIWVLPLTEYSKPVMAEHCRGNTYGYHMTWLKQLSTWLWGCFFSCYRLNEEKQNHFRRYSIDSGLVSTEGYNMVWTTPKTLYTSNSRESLHLWFYTGLLGRSMCSCVSVIYTCIYVSLYISITTSRCIYWERAMKTDQQFGPADQLSCYW